jgi:hypothetical protein
MSDGRQQRALTPVRNSHFKSRQSFCGENDLVLVIIRDRISISTTEDHSDRYREEDQNTKHL